MSEPGKHRSQPPRPIPTDLGVHHWLAVAFLALMFLMLAGWGLWLLVT